MSIERKAGKLVIELDNILLHDAIALKKMFERMEYLGNIGSSRVCSFFADGDGSFRPKVKVDYHMDLPEVDDISGVDERTGDFNIDSDSIAWKIYHD